MEGLKSIIANLEAVSRRSLTDKEIAEHYGKVCLAVDTVLNNVSCQAFFCLSTKNEQGRGRIRSQGFRYSLFKNALVSSIINLVMFFLCYNRKIESKHCNEDSKDNQYSYN